MAEQIPRRAAIRAGALLGVGAVVGGCSSGTPTLPSSMSATVSSAPPSNSQPTTAPPALSPPATTPPNTSPRHTASSTASTSASSPPGPTTEELRRTIAGLLILGFRGATMREAASVAQAISTQGLGGVIVFDQGLGGSRNISSPSQLKALISGLQMLAGGRLIVGIDQEGGIIARLGPATGFPAVASQASIGATGSLTQAHRWAAGLAATLQQVGVTLNFAPVVDANVNPTNPAIGALGRSFSADPNVVAQMALAEIAEHHSRGVATTMKHFPGLGSAEVNTDFGIADVTVTWSSRELEPFRAVIAAGVADVVMAAHLINRNLDSRYPASLSHSMVTGLLRGQLGWQGPVVTDDMGAAAIRTTFGQVEAIALALNAGCDLLLLGNQVNYDPNLTTTLVNIIVGLVNNGAVTWRQLKASSARVDKLRGVG